MLNGIVGFQLLDDGTPVSLGAMLGSAGVLFIGTGYIALDTAFMWTGYFKPSLSAPYTNYGLYVLYLFVPLICIVVFFCLETVLVLRVLGEKKPMRKFAPRLDGRSTTYARDSVLAWRSPPVRHRADLRFSHQQVHLHRNGRQDRRRAVRDALHSPGRGHGLGVLVEHHRGRLEHARPADVSVGEGRRAVISRWNQLLTT